MKTRIFIDFWNFQLGINDVAPQNYRADWKKISPWLIAQATAAVGRPLSFEGTHVYMSYSPNSRKDAPLKDFATNVLSRFPGVQVSLVERKAQSAPTCPACHQSIPNCPHCGSPINRMVEKGVDTAIVTDMVKFALSVMVLVGLSFGVMPAMVK